MDDETGHKMDSLYVLIAVLPMIILIGACGWMVGPICCFACCGSTRFLHQRGADMLTNAEAGVAQPTQPAHPARPIPIIVAEVQLLPAQTVSQPVWGVPYQSPGGVVKHGALQTGALAEPLTADAETPVEMVEIVAGVPAEPPCACTASPAPASDAHRG